MHGSLARRWLTVPSAVIFLAAVSAPALAAADSPASTAGPAATTTSAAATSFTGQVRDGRRIEHGRVTNVTVPDGLPVVRGATVSLPGLHRTTITNAAGQFTFRDLHVTAAASYTLRVREKGFGQWQETGIKLYAGISAQLYVELQSNPVKLRAPKPLTQPYNGPSRTPATASGCAGNSSGWTSQSEQPPIIRVYMTGVHGDTGAINDYDFSFYEQHVLPNEWEAGWDQAALQAGSVAVRDYAWYWILNGSKGTGYGNPNPCAYDVDDSTDYQDFDPFAPTYSSTNDAVNSTAEYLYTHDSAIPETSFNAGDPGDACGQDYGQSGTLDMSQNGSQNCAQAGYSWQGILQKYYDYGLGVYGSRGPAAAVDENGDKFVYWENTGGGLEEAYYTASTNRWSSPSEITAGGNGMGPLGSPPTVAVTGQYSGSYPDQYVFWKGTGSASKLWEAYWNGSWHGPIDLGKGPLGSAPTAAGDTAGAVDVFWKTPGGNLEETFSSDPSSSGSWDAPQEITAGGKGMGPLGSSPSVAADAATGDQYVFWKGPGGPLYYTYYNGSWHSPQEIPGSSPLASPPSAGADDAGNVYVFWENTGGGVEEVYSSDPGQASSYDAPSAITVNGSGMGPIGSAPTVGVNPATSGQHVFWKGTNAALWEAEYVEGWSGPTSHGDGPLG